MAKKQSLWVTLGFFAGIAGCQHPLGSAPEATVLPVAMVPEGAVIKKEGNLPMRDPKANTCVAYGDFRVAEASAPDQIADARDQMREQARKAYLQALEIEPKNLKAHQGLARLQAASGDHEQAVATLKNGLKFHPREASLWYDLGMAHSRKKEWVTVLAALDKAAQLEPQNRTYVNMYGYALARNGRYDESLACFARLNGEAKAHYNLARMLNHLDQREESKKHLQLSLHLDPTLEPARQLLSKLENTTGLESQPVTKAEGPALPEIQPEGYPLASRPQPLAPAPAAPAPLPDFDNVQNQAPVQPGRDKGLGEGQTLFLLPPPPMTLAQPAPTAIVTSVGTLERAGD